jgi:hypothetical protein
MREVYRCARENICEKIRAGKILKRFKAAPSGCGECRTANRLHERSHAVTKHTPQTH